MWAATSAIQTLARRWLPPNRAASGASCRLHLSWVPAGHNCQPPSQRQTHSKGYDGQGGPQGLEADIPLMAGKGGGLFAIASPHLAHGKVLRRSTETTSESG